MSTGNRASVVLVLAAAAWGAGCAPGAREAEEAIREYCQAVQDRDLDRLACRSAGGAGTEPDRFRAWADSQYREYLEGRDLGSVDVESGGIAMVKAFSLGKGTFYRVDRVRRLDGALAARMTLTFGYGSINLTGLVPGTTFYVAGAPPGTVHPIVVPEGRDRIERTVLSSLQLDWTLLPERDDGHCGERWAVNSVEVVDGSEETVLLEWWF